MDDLCGASRDAPWEMIPKITFRRTADRSTATGKFKRDRPNIGICSLALSVGARRRERFSNESCIPPRRGRPGVRFLKCRAVKRLQAASIRAMPGHFRDVPRWREDPRCCGEEQGRADSPENSGFTTETQRSRRIRAPVGGASCAICSPCLMQNSTRFSVPSVTLW